MGFRPKAVTFGLGMKIVSGVIVGGLVAILLIPIAGWWRTEVGLSTSKPTQPPPSPEPPDLVARIPATTVCCAHNEVLPPHITVPEVEWHTLPKEDGCGALVYTCPYPTSSYLEYPISSKEWAEGVADLAIQMAGRELAECRKSSRLESPRRNMKTAKEALTQSQKTAENRLNLDFETHKRRIEDGIEAAINSGERVLVYTMPLDKSWDGILISNIVQLLESLGYVVHSTSCAGNSQTLHIEW